MKNYNCEYSREGKKLDIGDNWYKTIEANNPREAYEKFIKDVGVFEKPVIVDGGNFLKGPELFSDHIETLKRKADESKRKTDEAKRKADEAKRKVDIIDLIKKLNLSSCNNIDYIKISPDLRSQCDSELKILAKKNVNQWSEEEGNLYLTFRDYLGRKEFINFKLESIASDGSISQKLDSISLMLNQMSKKQKAVNSKSSNASSLSIMAAMHQMNED